MMFNAGMSVLYSDILVQRSAILTEITYFLYALKTDVGVVP